MTDRFFSDCCYGTKHQHAEWLPCPVAASRAECERLARQIWADREKTFPRFVQQTWEQGTLLARDATLIEAAKRLGLIPAIADRSATAPRRETGVARKGESGGAGTAIAQGQVT